MECATIDYEGEPMTKVTYRQRTGGRDMVQCIVVLTQDGKKHGSEVHFAEDGGVRRVLVWERGYMQSSFPNQLDEVHNTPYHTSRTPSPTASTSTSEPWMTGAGQHEHRGRLWNLRRRLASSTM